MKRTFLSVGMTALTAFCLFSIIDSKVIKVIFAVAFIAFFLFLIFKKIRFDGTLPIIAATVCCCCVIFTVFDLSVQKKTEGLTEKGEKHIISGEIVSLPTFNNGRAYYTVKTETIDGAKNRQKIRLSLRTDINASPYDIISGEVNLYRLGAFSDEIENYYSSKGLFLGGYPDYDTQLTVTSHSGFHPMYYVLMSKKELTDSIIKNIPGENGGLLTGLLIGDKTAIDKQTLDDFSSIGSYHLLAVSGLHITVWAGFIYALLSALHLRKKLRFILSIAFILFFMALTGFNPPVVRAGILMIFVILGYLSGREADSLNSIGFAVTLMLLINPYAAYSKSLWLSVFASFGIILLSKTVYEFIKRHEFKNRFFEFVNCFVFQSFAVSISVAVFTFPLCVLFFDKISLVTLFSNLVLIEISSAAMLLTGFASLFFLVGLSFVSNPLYFLAAFFAKLIIGFSHWLASFEMITVSTSGMAVKVTAVIIPALLILIYYLKIKNGKNFKYSDGYDIMKNSNK